LCNCKTVKELRTTNQNLSTMPDFNQATPFKTACKAVEQVIEWEISGPELCKS
jgi:hypothetical protein